MKLRSKPDQPSCIICGRYPTRGITFLGEPMDVCRQHRIEAKVAPQAFMCRLFEVDTAMYRRINDPS